MKLGLLLDERLHQALARLCGQPLPLATAFALKGIKKKIDETLVLYEETRQEALKRYGKKDESGALSLSDGMVQFDDQARDEFLKELNDLLNQDVDVGRVTFSSLGESAKISADDLMALDGLVD